MKWNDTFILLCCGTIMGGVFTPIFMTDVLGVNRMIEWFPAGLDFDWGSFLGGSIAGVAAFGVFMIQRLVDLRAAQRMKTATVKAACARALMALEQLINDSGTSKDKGGAADVADHCSQIASEWSEHGDATLDATRVLVFQFCGYYGSLMERIWMQFSGLVPYDGLPVSLTDLMLKIGAKEEEIRRLTQAVKLDSDQESWANAGTNVQIRALRAPRELMDLVPPLEEDIRLLMKECG